jgi:hypothetical protein
MPAKLVNENFFVIENLIIYFLFHFILKEFQDEGLN